MSLAGYSGTPLPKKLGFKPGHIVALFAPPDDYATTLGDLPPWVTLRDDGRARADVIHYFTKGRARW